MIRENDRLGTTDHFDAVSVIHFMHTLRRQIHNFINEYNDVLCSSTQTNTIVDASGQWKLHITENLSISDLPSVSAPLAAPGITKTWAIVEEGWYRGETGRKINKNKDMPE